MNLAISQAFLRAILLNPMNYGWTVQGFGMIRTYLDEQQRWRLNIWDDRLRTPGVSLIHDHPWSFTSYLVAGKLRNRRYACDEDSSYPTHFFKRIQTGPDGADASGEHTCQLACKALENYEAGMKYSQLLNEVHETDADRGTVTLNDRTPPIETYTARVFWQIDHGKWMAARPRAALRHEVLNACEAAYKLL
jgi:hypothetical protein